MFRHLEGHLRVGVGGKSAVAAAWRTVPVLRRLDQLTAQAPRQLPDGVLGLCIPSGAAGVVHRCRPLQAPAALWQAKLQQHLPDPDDVSALSPLQLFLAGGAARNDHRVAQLPQLPVQKGPRLPFQLLAPGPVADGAAAAQHQRNAALQPLCQVQVGRLYRLRRNGRGLAAGKKDIPAAFKAGLQAGEEGVAVGKEHVRQGKLMGRQGHLVGGNHVLPCHMAHSRHIEAVGAHHGALPAEGTAVHGLVHLMVAHNDLGVVVDLFGQKPRMLFVMLEVGAAFQALLAAALQAAPCLRNGLLFGVARLRQGHPAQPMRLAQVGVKAALHRPLLSPAVSGMKVLGQPVHGEDGLLGPEGRVQHSPSAAAADQPLLLAEHQLLAAYRVGHQRLCHRLGDAEDIKLLPLFFQKIPRERAVVCKMNVLALQALALQGEGGLIQKGRGAAQKAPGVRLRAEHRHRIGLLFQFSGQKQRKQVRAQDGCGFSLHAAEHAAPGRLSVAGHRLLHRPDGQALSHLAQAAFSLARRLAAGREHQREGGDLLI